MSVASFMYFSEKKIKSNSICFFLQVVAVVEGCCSRNLKVSFPITIGTYPIQDNIMTQPTAPQVGISLPYQVPLAEMQPTAPEMPADANGFAKPPYSAQSNDPTAPPSYDMEKELTNSKITKFPFFSNIRKHFRPFYF